MPKEITAWAYVRLFEKYNFQTLKKLLNQPPAAYQKRRIIMERKKAGLAQTAPWFK